MRHYETIFIVKPTLGEEEYKETLRKYTDIIEKSKGSLIKTEEWGKQELAYVVRKFDKGFYVLFDYCGEPGITDSLERDLKIDDRVLKFQTVKLADKADPEKLRKKAESTPTAKEEQIEQVEQAGVPGEPESTPQEERAATEEAGDGIQ